MVAPKTRDQVESDAWHPFLSLGTCACLMNESVCVAKASTFGVVSVDKIHKYFTNAAEGTHKFI
jgi:hypothetical protein